MTVPLCLKADKTLSLAVILNHTPGTRLSILDFSYSRNGLLSPSRDWTIFGLLTNRRLFLNILAVGLPFEHCRFTD